MRRSSASVLGCATTAFLLLILACGGSADEIIDLKFKPATLEGTLLACELVAPVRNASVKLSAGGSVDARFAAADSIEFRMARSTNLIVRDITATNPAGTPSFEVVLFPESDEANRIKQAFRDRPGCYWLVTLRGKIVQLEFPGERGDGGISGGLFSSVDAALTAYGRTRDEISLEVVPDSEGSQARAFWAWRQRMDVWEMACDPDFQKRFRENDPKNFELLRETFENVDCSTRPHGPSAEFD